MVTKAELEKQVTELKRQLEERSEQAPAQAAPEADTMDTTSDLSEKLSETLDEWAGELDDVLTELDSLPHKKAILFALGVFALGYMMGRAR
ncbi:hypothetical protein SAMN05444279_11725 [Ruegeria intermedia]|uniref:Uncharacterized protein n=1 Tax=Ruegeria intermedia TaxID=996115 RepID=A0A1M4YX88_9RHOB|nr:hypothetical protein [Ruegeria intermedia]SHF10350.1 hypothetical protein SAMN05444279_11725 [Ruegeria intermedia]